MRLQDIVKMGRSFAYITYLKIRYGRSCHMMQSRCLGKECRSIVKALNRLELDADCTPETMYSYLLMGEKSKLVNAFS